MPRITDPLILQRIKATRLPPKARPEGPGPGTEGADEKKGKGDAAREGKRKSLLFAQEAMPKNVYRRGKRYRAQFRRPDGRNVACGTWDTPEEAARAVDRAKAAAGLILHSSALSEPPGSAEV